MQVLGVCSIRIYAKNMGDPYYEPTIVVHDYMHTTHMYAHTHAHTTHTHKSKKAKPLASGHAYPVKQHWDICVPLIVHVGTRSQCRD